MVFLVLLIAVLFFLCLGEFGLGEFDFVSSPLGRRQGRRAVSSRRVGYLWLARPFRLATRAPPELARG
jgi:hypothetical protein